MRKYKLRVPRDLVEPRAQRMRLTGLVMNSSSWWPAVNYCATIYVTQRITIIPTVLTSLMPWLNWIRSSLPIVCSIFKYTSNINNMSALFLTRHLEHPISTIEYTFKVYLTVFVYAKMIIYVRCPSNPTTLTKL